MTSFANTDWKKLASMMTIKRGSHATQTEKEKAASYLKSIGWTDNMIRHTWTSRNKPIKGTIFA